MQRSHFGNTLVMDRLQTQPIWNPRAKKRKTSYRPPNCTRPWRNYMTYKNSRLLRPALLSSLLQAGLLPFALAVQSCALTLLSPQHALRWGTHRLLNTGCYAIFAALRQSPSQKLVMMKGWLIGKRTPRNSEQSRVSSRWRLQQGSEIIRPGSRVRCMGINGRLRK